MSGSPPPPGEFEIIARYFAPLATTVGAFGLVDDAAVLAPPPGRDLVLTKDALVADVHFFRDDPPETIAQKALRVNLSDLAAKGAEPLFYLIGLGLPGGIGEDWIAAFAGGLAADQAEFGITLLGGDTVKSPERLVLSITAIGTVPAGRAVRRAGARPGDLLFVTGTIGDAALGLKLRRDGGLAARLGLTPDDAAFLRRRYLVPEPRVAAAVAIRDLAGAAMDISDGFAGDLAKLAAVSKAGLEIDADRVPLSPAARRAVAAEPALLPALLCGGDDYEIAGAVSVDNFAPLCDRLAIAGISVSSVGRVVAGSGVRVCGTDGSPIEVGQGAYIHF